MVEINNKQEALSRNRPKRFIDHLLCWDLGDLIEDTEISKKKLSHISKTNEFKVYYETTLQHIVLPPNISKFPSFLTSSITWTPVEIVNNETITDSIIHNKNEAIRTFSNDLQMFTVEDNNDPSLKYMKYSLLNENNSFTIKTPFNGLSDKISITSPQTNDNIVQLDIHSLIDLNNGSYNVNYSIRNNLADIVHKVVAFPLEIKYNDQIIYDKNVYFHHPKLDKIIRDVEVDLTNGKLELIILIYN